MLNGMLAVQNAGQVSVRGSKGSFQSSRQLSDSAEFYPENFQTSPVSVIPKLYYHYLDW
jgi:hypothetical protein